MTKRAKPTASARYETKTLGISVVRDAGPGARYRLATDEETQRRLGRVRQKDTSPEQIVRAALSEMGIKYRLDAKDLPGSPDIVNRSKKWAVFVHGCYWHHHEGCRKATIPKRNREFWIAKFAANRARDARAVEVLEALGYRVIVVWQCETEDRVGLTRLAGLA